jgi:hypothetical protein
MVKVRQSRHSHSHRRRSRPADSEGRRRRRSDRESRPTKARAEETTEASHEETDEKKSQASESEDDADVESGGDEEFDVSGSSAAEESSENSGSESSEKDVDSEDCSSDEYESDVSRGEIQKRRRYRDRHRRHGRRERSPSPRTKKKNKKKKEKEEKERTEIMILIRAYYADPDIKAIIKEIPKKVRPPRGHDALDKRSLTKLRTDKTVIEDAITSKMKIQPIKALGNYGAKVAETMVMTSPMFSNFIDLTGFSDEFKKDPDVQMSLNLIQIKLRTQLPSGPYAQLAASVMMLANNTRIKNNMRAHALRMWKDHEYIPEYDLPEGKTAEQYGEELIAEEKKKEESFQKLLLVARKGVARQEAAARAQAQQAAPIQQAVIVDPPPRIGDLNRRRRAAKPVENQEERKEMPAQNTVRAQVEVIESRQLPPLPGWQPVIIGLDFANNSQDGSSTTPSNSGLSLSRDTKEFAIPEKF